MGEINGYGIDLTTKKAIHQLKNLTIVQKNIIFKILEIEDEEVLVDLIDITTSCKTKRIRRLVKIFAKRLAK